MSRTGWRAPAAVGAVAAVLAATACTGTGADPAADGGERVYIEALGEDPSGMNPQFAGGPVPLRFGFAVLGTLVEVNDRYEIEPGLAEAWEVSDDGTQITLDIRDGVEWHDGEPFTVDDVIFNVEEIMPLQTFGKPLTDSIAEISAPDDDTVVLELASQYGPFFEALSQQTLVPKHLYEGTDYVTNPANMAPVGTGPMMFESYEPGSEVVLVKNPNWWRGETEVDRAIYPVISDVNARTMALLAGEIDAAVIDPAQQDQVEADPDLTLTERGVFRQTIPVTFNAELPELESPEVRAALFAAIDRDAVADLALGGLAEPANRIFPDTLEWALADDVDYDASFPRDVEAIGAALDEAGFPEGDDGWRFTLDLRYIAALSDVGAVAEVVKSSLEEVGVQVNLLGTAEPVYMETVFQTGDFGLMLLRNTVGADPSIGLTRWLTCNPERRPVSNASGICDDELDAAANEALSTVDRDARAEALRTVQQRAAELVHWMPLAWTNGSNYTVSTARWAGLDAGDGQTNTPKWADLRWNG